MAESNGHSTTLELADTEPVAAAPRVEFGTTGLNRWGGVVQEEFLNALKQEKGKLVYREMSENDPVVGAILLAIKMIVRQVEWRVKPFDDSNESALAAQFLTEAMDDMSFSWNDFISEILTFLPFGFAYFECVYKYRTQGMEPSPDGTEYTPSQSVTKYNDGKVGWQKFAFRAQETINRWEFDAEGGIQGAYQQAPPAYAETLLPIGKCLLFRTEVVKNNPEGRSILRHAYRPWWFKKNIEEIEGIGVERDLAGLPVLQPPVGVDLWSPSQAENLRRAERLVKNVRNDEQAGIVLPPGWIFSLVSATGGKNFNTEEIIGRLDRRIAMSALAMFVMVGMDETGSYSLADSQQDVFQLSLTGYVDSMAETLNKHAVPKLFYLNGTPMEQMSKLPTIEHSAVGGPSLNELAGYITRLASVGMIFPDTDLETYIRRYAKLPDRGETAVESPVLKIPGMGGVPEQAKPVGNPSTGGSRQPANPDGGGLRSRPNTRQARGGQ